MKVTHAFVVVVNSSASGQLAMHVACVHMILASHTSHVHAQMGNLLTLYLTYKLVCYS